MRAQTQPDLYAVMHLDPSCTDEEIKAQWRRFALVFHPDTHPGDRWFEEEFKKIEAAYEVLGHADRRAAYDHDRLAPAPEPIQYEHVERVTPAYEPPAAKEVDLGPQTLPRISLRAWLATAAFALTFAVMIVTLIRTYRANHQLMRIAPQIIDGSAITAPVYERSSDPTIRAQQDGLQARLTAVQPQVDEQIAQARAADATLQEQDQIESRGNPTWTPPVDRARDEAALTADIGQLQFRMAEIEQQIDQLGTPSGADQGSISQDLDMLVSPHPPILDDVSLAEHDLRSDNRSR